MVHVFIINPAIGKRSLSVKLRKDLEARDDIKYFVFNTLRADHEATLVNQLRHYIDGDTIRFYVVGGLGTLHKVFNGLGENFENVELAWLPIGVNNNLIKCFGPSNAARFINLEELINGKAIYMDYIKTNHGLALNAMSIGSDSACIKYSNNNVGTINSLQYKFVQIYSVLTSKPVRAELTINEKYHFPEEDRCEIFFGNGSFIGGGLRLGTNSILNDGQGEYLIGPNLKGFSYLSALSTLGKIGPENYKIIKTGRANKIEIKSQTLLSVNLDGELYEGFNDWEAEIVSDKLKFVIPRHMKTPALKNPVTAK